jgi:hypothetical protein
MSARLILLIMAQAELVGAILLVLPRVPQQRRDFGALVAVGIASLLAVAAMTLTT